jgi:hypothetical protein
MVLGQAEPRGRGLKRGPALCTRFSVFLFSFKIPEFIKVLKCVENRIKLEKYETNFYRIILSRYLQ